MQVVRALQQEPPLLPQLLVLVRNVPSLVQLLLLVSTVQFFNELFLLLIPLVNGFIGTFHFLSSFLSQLEVFFKPENSIRGNAAVIRISVILRLLCAQCVGAW